MTPQILTLVASAILSILFSYVPGLAGWYNGLANATHKRLIMLGLLLITTAASFALACSGLGESLKISATCDQAGAVELITAFVLAIAANQSTYLITPKKK
jgi:exosortase/archaeosortase